MTITRKQALCILYSKEYTEQNAKKINTKIKKKKLEVCHISDPFFPCIVPVCRLFASPQIYKTYEDEIKKDNGKTVQMIEPLVHTVQVNQIIQVPSEHIAEEATQVTSQEIIQENNHEINKETTEVIKLENTEEVSTRAQAYKRRCIIGKLSVKTAL